MKHSLQLYLFSLLLYLPLNVLGQSQITQWRDLSIGLGVSFAALRDNAITPLTRKGTAIPVGLRFESRGSRSWHETSLFYTNYNYLTSAYGNATATQTGQLKYTYRHNVSHWHGWELWAGGVFSVEGYLLSTLDGFGNASNATALITLNPSLAITRSIGPGSLNLTASAGLVGYVIRPNYSRAYEGVNTFAEFVKAGQIEIPPGVFNASATYYAYLSPKFRLRLDYQWQLLINRQPRVVGLLTNQATLSLAYRFIPHRPL